MADHFEHESEAFWNLLQPAARSFEETTEWPNLDDLLYEAAIRGEVVDLNLRSEIPNAYGFVDHDGKIILTGLGLIRSGEAPLSSAALVNVVQLCVKLALQFRKNAKLTAEAIVDEFGADNFLLDRASVLARSVIGLTGGGGTNLEGTWWWDITVSALEYRDVQSVDALESFLMERVAEQHRLIAQATAMPFLGPWGQTASLTGRGNVFETTTQSTDEVPCDPHNVFVVYGRDKEATAALWTYLEALGLHPLNWDELVRSTGTATPYTGAVVAKAFDQVKAVVVLLTPDDEARLHDTLREDSDGGHERELTGQPRPNVFFEAGMAFGRHPNRTIVVEIGSLRTATDLSGLNVVRLNGTEGPLMALADRLEGAGCPVNRAHPAWLDTDRFKNLTAHTRRPVPHSSDALADPPRGTRLAKTTHRRESRLTARLMPKGSTEYLLEIVNRGGTDLKNVAWQLPDGAENWVMMTDVLPQYPFAKLAQSEHFRVPVLVLMPGPVMIELQITATDPDGSEYLTSAHLSIYG